MAAEGLNYGLYKKINIEMLKILKKKFYMVKMQFNTWLHCIYDKTVFKFISMADGQIKNTFAPKGP